MATTSLRHQVSGVSNGWVSGRQTHVYFSFLTECQGGGLVAWRRTSRGLARESKGETRQATHERGGEDEKEGEKSKRAEQAKPIRGALGPVAVHF